MAFPCLIMQRRAAGRQGRLARAFCRPLLVRAPCLGADVGPRAASYSLPSSAAGSSEGIDSVGFLPLPLGSPMQPNVVVPPSRGVLVIRGLRNGRRALVKLRRLSEAPGEPRERQVALVKCRGGRLGPKRAAEVRARWRGLSLVEPSKRVRPRVVRRSVGHCLDRRVKRHARRGRPHPHGPELPTWGWVERQPRLRGAIRRRSARDGWGGCMHAVRRAERAVRGLPRKAPWSRGGIAVGSRVLRGRDGTGARGKSIGKGTCRQ